MNRFLTLILTITTSLTMQAQDKAPTLTGNFSFEEFSNTQHKKEWFNKNYSSYNIDQKVLKKLKKAYNGQSAVAFLGSWCSDTQKHWPVFMKVWEQIGNIEDVELYFVGLDKEVDDPEFQKFKFEYVPTIFILDSDGKVIGKFVETPKKSVEEDLLEILKD